MCLSTLQEVRGCPISFFQLRFPSDDIFFWSLCDYLCCAEVTLPTICWDRGNARKLQLSRACSRFSVARSFMRRDRNILESSMMRIMIVWSIPRPHCGGDVGSELCKATYDSEPEHSADFGVISWVVFLKRVPSILRPKQRFPVFGLSGGNTT